jgi:hypothetical protein
MSEGGGWIALLIGGLILYSCTRESDDNPDSDDYAPASYITDTENAVAAEADVSQYSGGSEVADEPTREAFDEDSAREAAEDEVADHSYTGIGSPYGCTVDCSGHEAGFRYRADNGYAGFNADSPSFNEGGQAFDDAVEERVEEMQSAYESGEEPDY